MDQLMEILTEVNADVEKWSKEGGYVDYMYC